jgi:PAS domain S-box-containing protein
VFSLIEALPSAIVFISDGRITGWNDAAAALYGWRTHEAVGQEFDRLLIDDSDRSAALDVLRGVASRGRWEGDFRVRRRDGALLVSSFLAAVVRGPDGAPCTAWVATDVVDQHLAEQEREVLLSAERAARQELETTIGIFEALLESAPIGIAVLDLELRCRQANPMLVTMIGTDRPPVGEYLDDLATLPPEVAADLRRVATTGRVLIDRKLQLKGTAAPQPRQISANYFPIYSGQHNLTGVGLTWTDVTGATLAEGERAELTQRATEAQRRLAVLASASSVLMTTTDVDALIERLARVLAPAAAEWCVIELIGKSGIIEHVAVSHADRERAQHLRDTLFHQPAEPSPDSPVAAVRRTGQAFLFSPADVTGALDRSVRTPSQKVLYEGIGLTSGILVPIKNRGETLGILGLSNTGETRLTDDDLDVAVEIAHRAALALGRAITYRNEHVLAEQLQQALLPKSLPVVEGLDVAVRYSAAADTATVGGDWYDVFRLSETQVVLAVGDVVGHDTHAAISMSRLRYLINAFAVEASHSGGELGRHIDPHEIFARIDRLVHDDSSAWATCVIAVLDTASGELRWSTAGHPTPLLVRDGAVRSMADGHGPMLGVVRDAPRHTDTMTLYEGDRVLLYTDGLFERRRESIEIGLTRLADTVRAFSARPLHEFCDEVTGAMFAGAPQTDDMAILAVDFRPTS